MYLLLWTFLTAVGPSSQQYFSPSQTKPHTYIRKNGFTYFTCPEHYCGVGGSCKPRTMIIPYHPCYCDVYCELLHDCCLEYLKCTTSIDMVLLLSEDILTYQEFYGCPESGFTAVSKCPPSAPAHLKSACEKDESCDLYHRIPVVADGVVFRNLYCAQCHDLGLANVTQFWQVQIGLRRIVDLSLATVWEMIFSGLALQVRNMYGRCTKFRAVPAEPRTYFLRHCPYEVYKYNDLGDLTGVVASCDPSLRHAVKHYSVLDRECLIYRADVYGRTKQNKVTRFKNMFCAKCNGIDELDLFCPMPVMVAYPPFDLDLTPQLGGRVIVTLDILMNLDHTKHCDADQVFDYATKRCVSHRRCGLSEVFWEEECVRDPFDLAYATPVVTQQGGGSLHLNVTIFLPFMIVLTQDQLDDPALWSEAFIPALQRMMYEPNMVPKVKEISVNLNASQATKQVDLLDGTELHFAANTNFMVYVDYVTMTYKRIQYIDAYIRHFREWTKTVNVNYEVYSKAMSAPVQCKKGELVFIKNTTKHRRYLAERRGSEDLNKLVWMRNRTDMYIATCALYTSRFPGCSVVNYSLDHFRMRPGVLTHKDSGKNLTDYVVLGNEVFTCYDPHWEVSIHTFIQAILTMVGLSLSCLFLAFTIMTYCVFPVLRNLPGLMLMNLCIALLLSQIIFLTSLNFVAEPTACKAVAVILHFLWLSTFFWMNATAFDMTWTFTARLQPAGKSVNYTAFFLSALYSYGIPGVGVTACAVLERYAIFRVGYGPASGRSGQCWLTERDGLLYAFIVPIAVLIFVNIVLYTVAASSIYRTRKLVQQAKARPRNKAEFLIYIRLFTLMGFTWIFGFIGAFYNHVAVWYLFTIFNSLTGVFIGVSFTLNKRVFKLWVSVFKKEKKATPIKQSQSTNSTTCSHRLSAVGRPVMYQTNPDLAAYF